jgi:hypothetical protein
MPSGLPSAEPTLEPTAVPTVLPTTEPLVWSALRQLYNTTGGAAGNWLWATNWMDAGPCTNSWYGVTCDPLLEYAFRVSTNTPVPTTTSMPTARPTSIGANNSAFFERRRGILSASALAPALTFARDPDHEFDFRGCTDGVDIVDTFHSSIRAAAKNGARCSENGMVFDGEDDYADVTPWEFGGTMTVEYFVMLSSVSDSARHFDFCDRCGADHVFIGNLKGSSAATFQGMCNARS